MRTSEAGIYVVFSRERGHVYFETMRARVNCIMQISVVPAEKLRGGKKIHQNSWPPLVDRAGLSLA